MRSVLRNSFPEKFSKLARKTSIVPGKFFYKVAGFKGSLIKHSVTNAIAKFFKIVFSWNIIEGLRLAVEDQFVTGSV